MNILAVDTSGPVCGVAVCDGTRVLYEGAAVNRLTQSVNLLPMAQEALCRAGLTVEQVDLFAAVVGPGSFTVRFLDALHNLTPEDVLHGARLREG